MFGLVEKALRKTRDSWFGQIFRIAERPGPEVWEELEDLLIAADVGVGTTRELLERVRKRLEREKERRDGVAELLKEEMLSLLDFPPPPTPDSFPWVVLGVGVNGSGKTTSLAKLAYRFKNEGKRTALVAADTFRAAAIEQLKEWGKRAGVEVFAQQQGADPGAVVYDALEAASARGIQVLLIDTAGRLHTKYNLMEELKKIKRVAGKKDPRLPQEVLLVLDATTGQNGLQQARSFTEAVGVNGIFLAKLDGTAKGGIVLAIARELRIPIRYIGTGEGLEDLAPFSPRDFVEALCRK